MQSYNLALNREKVKPVDLDFFPLHFGALAALYPPHRVFSFAAAVGNLLRRESSSMRYQRIFPWSCHPPACRPFQSKDKANELAKSPQIVPPANPPGRTGAGVQKTLERLDSRLRGNDRKKHFLTVFKFVELPTFCPENHP